jgi:hypothetical protein
MGTRSNGREGLVRGRRLEGGGFEPSVPGREIKPVMGDLAVSKRERICWGTEGSNSPPSSVESAANLPPFIRAPDPLTAPKLPVTDRLRSNPISGKWIQKRRAFDQRDRVLGTTPTARALYFSGNSRRARACATSKKRGTAASLKADVFSLIQQIAPPSGRTQSTYTFCF